MGHDLNMRHNVLRCMHNHMNLIWSAVNVVRARVEGPEASWGEEGRYLLCYDPPLPLSVSSKLLSSGKGQNGGAPPGPWAMAGSGHVALRAIWLVWDPQKYRP